MMEEMVSNVTQVESQSLHNWTSIIEDLVAMAENEHVRAFSISLQEGFGAAPWTVPETMSLGELLDASTGHEVAPSWARPLSTLPGDS